MVGHSNVQGWLFQNRVCRWTWTLVVQLAVTHHKAAVAGDFWFFDLASLTDRSVADHS